MAIAMFAMKETTEEKAGLRPAKKKKEKEKKLKFREF